MVIPRFRLLKPLQQHGANENYCNFASFNSVVDTKRYKWAKIRKRRNQKKIPTPKTEVGKNQTNNLDPVVQSIVSLTISLRHKFVKQISAKVTNALLFFVEGM